MTFVDQVKAGDSRTNGQKDDPPKIPGILYLDSSRKNDEVSELFIMILHISQWIMSNIKKMRQSKPY